MAYLLKNNYESTCSELVLLTEISLFYSLWISNICNKAMVEFYQPEKFSPEKTQFSVLDWSSDLHVAFYKNNIKRRKDWIKALGVIIM